MFFIHINFKVIIKNSITATMKVEVSRHWRHKAVINSYKQVCWGTNLNISTDYRQNQHYMKW